ncbi:CvpA family protein [Granulosicoccus sp. 3-233]|uniref:CvpA family protein n=1 Tax=Granulosicoccus sp. 3-233 TaxID=3417969 RepID=UPI003D34AF8C
MSEVDVVILALLAIAAVVGALRGFLREAMSLLVWLAAILLTLVYTSRFAGILPIEKVGSGQTRASISALVLFAGTLMVGNFINWVVGRATRRKAIAPPDRIIGAVFAFARALVMMTLLVLMANAVPDLREETWWRESRTLPMFQQMAQFIHARLPDGTWQYFDFPLTGN